MKEILVFGDSHVAGLELADARLYADHPGMRPWNSTDESKFPWYQRSMARRQKGDAKAIEHMEHSMAFPATMQRLTGVQVSNYGKSGSSQQRIHLAMVYGVMALFHKGMLAQNISVVLGLTSPQRLIHCQGNQKADIVMGATNMGSDKDGQRFNDVVVENWSDSFIHDLHTSHLLSSISFLKNNHIDFEIIDGRALQSIDDHLNDPRCSDFTKNGWKMIESMIGPRIEIPSLMKLANTHKIKEAIAPGNHYGKEVHDLMAEELTQRFKSRRSANIKHS